MRRNERNSIGNCSNFHQVCDDYDRMIEFSHVPDFLASQQNHVFISHSREADTMPIVDTLMLRLKQEGLSVFVYQHSIRSGDKWRSEIASAIHTCKAFVCVLTKRYVRSVYCNGELYEAVALGKRIFPVVCEDGWRDVPGGAPVTEVVQEVQLVSLVAGDRENQLARLVQSIKGQLVHCNHSTTSLDIVH